MSIDFDFKFPKFNSGVSNGRHFNNSFIVYGPDTHQQVHNFVPKGRFTVILYDSKVDLGDVNLGVIGDLAIAVTSEPDVSRVQEIIMLLPDTPCNVIAIGGGATMDLAKGIVCARHYPNDLRVGYGESGDLTSRIETAYDFLTLLPTTVGSGSEASRYFVLFQEKGKKASRSWQALPRVVVVDPNLISYLTPEIARTQLFDCWSHLTEVSLCNLEYSPFAMHAVEAAKLSLMDFVKSEGQVSTVQSRLGLQVLSYIGGSAISNTRTGALHTVGEALASQITMPHVWSLYFSALNYEILLRGEYRSSQISIGGSNVERAKSALADLAFWIPYLKQIAGKQLQLDLKEIEAFDFEEFEDVVLGDKVLWNKEHPVNLKKIDVTRYLRRTLAEVKSFSQTWGT